MFAVADGDQLAVFARLPRKRAFGSFVCFLLVALKVACSFIWADDSEARQQQQRRRHSVSQ